MTEKVCQLYEEEQVGKTREGRKAVPTNKMPEPDLGWDIAETQLVYEKQENNDSHKTPPLQTLVTVIIMLITVLEHITAYVKEILKLVKRTARVAKSMITKASHNELLQNIKDSYKTTILAIAIVTNTKDRTNHSGQGHTTNRNVKNYPDTQKLSNEYGRPYQSYTSRTTITAGTSTTSCSTVSINFMQRPNTETKTPKHKTLNNALVTMNEVVSITWKLSVNLAPSHT